jgi:hypothetical protein
MKLLALVVLIAAFAACAGDDLVTGDRQSVGVLTVVFTASPARVQVGQPVRLTLRVSNNGGKIEHLTSPTAMQFDFWAKDGSREVWRWSTDQVFVQTLTTTDIESQASKSFNDVWRPTEAGSFTVFGELQAEGFKGAMKGTVVVR